MSGFQYLVPTAAASVQAIYSQDGQLTFPANLTTSHTIVLGDALVGNLDSYELKFVLAFNGVGTYNVVLNSYGETILNGSIVITNPDPSYAGVSIRGLRGFAGDEITGLLSVEITINDQSSLVNLISAPMLLGYVSDIEVRIACPVANSALLLLANAFKILAP